jgi:hypothetical protein
MHDGVQRWWQNFKGEGSTRFSKKRQAREKRTKAPNKKHKLTN